jgi:hypothetical protein
VHLALALSLLTSAPAAPLAADLKAMSLEEVPASLAPFVARANAAADVLRDRLYGRLNEVLVEKGAATAVDVCSTDAPRLAKEVAEAHHAEMGRTSHKVRNPANAPRAWAAPFVKAAAGKKGAEVKPVVVDLGDRVGLLRPIAVTPACSRCHGPVEGIDPAVRAATVARYPQDQATGFSPGDLRGFIWVEVRKR